MYNIVCFIKKGEYDYELLINEVLLYMDLKIGEVLEQFENLYIGEMVDVLYVWNLFVN